MSRILIATAKLPRPAAHFRTLKLAISVLFILLSMHLTVVRFLAEKPHEEGYGQRPRVVERAEFRGFRQMKISGLTRLAVR